MKRLFFTLGKTEVILHEETQVVGQQRSFRGPEPQMVYADLRLQSPDMSFEDVKDVFEIMAKALREAGYEVDQEDRSHNPEPYHGLKGFVMR